MTLIVGGEESGDETEIVFEIVKEVYDDY